jgi:hypothetical protein
MQLHLTDRAAQAQEQAVVEQPWIIDGGVIGDQGAGHGSEFQQAVPRGRVPCQPGDFQGQDDADLAQPDR